MENTALILPEENQFKQDIQAINRFQQVVHSNLIEDQDYGVIPGTVKPTLLKPGAEKIAKLLGLSDQYLIMDKQEDWKAPFFRYLIKCQLIYIKTGIVISEGLGECNSMEAKYRWREQKRKCPTCGAETIIKGKSEYGGGWVCFKKIGGCGATWKDGVVEIEDQKIGRVENEDIYDQVNTVLKMAKKRALVDAALSAGRLSNVFTQDVEDTVHEEIKIEKPKAKPKEETKVSPIGESKQKSETKPDGEPKNAGELLTWVASHGKEYDKEWTLRNFSCTPEDIQKDPVKIYKEAKQLMGW